MAREMRTIGKEFTAEIWMYEVCKYTSRVEEFKKVTYPAVVNWEIVNGEDAREIEEQGLVDDMHEYLVLHFADGDSATFRNSYVDMFR